MKFNGNRSVPSNFMSDSDYSVITSDVIKSFDCKNDCEHSINNYFFCRCMLMKISSVFVGWWFDDSRGSLILWYLLLPLPHWKNPTSEVYSIWWHVVNIILAVYAIVIIEL